MLKRIGHHKVSNLRSCRIVELIQNDIASVTVFSGKTLLFRAESDCLAEAKQCAVDFLSNEDALKIKFEANHRRFLLDLGVAESDTVELEASASSRRRETHCFGCQSDLQSDFHFECSRCRWLVCGCGTCGCGYTNYV